MQHIPSVPLLLSVLNTVGLFLIGSFLQLEAWTIILVLMITFAFTALILHGRISKHTKNILTEVLICFDISSMFVLVLFSNKFGFLLWLFLSLCSSAEFICCEII